MIEDKKHKFEIPRQPMPERVPLERVLDFMEVPLGYAAEAAVAEADRCLQCKDPQCVKGCPVGINIPGFIKLILEGKPGEAARKIKETSSLPAVCGRVCPQEDQCEKLCIVGKKHKPVAIGNLERYAADWEREHGVEVPEIKPPTGKRIAVVGSGPAGLSCAGDLAKMGHSVTIFEALHKPGGVLIYGIPEYRLPKKIVEEEIDYLRKLGVKIVLDALIGRTYTIDDLLEEFDAVFVGTGAGHPTFLDIPGENLNGVYSANEYLTRINLMKANLFPQSHTPVTRGKNVIVIGGGNVAMDAARTALRTKAETVTLIYRRGREELPARLEEIERAEEEGVKFQFLTSPLWFLGDSEGWVAGVECQKMELEEPDSTGRRKPVPVEGSEFVMPTDMVIVAIGTDSNRLLTSVTPGLEANKRGYIVIDEETGRTSKEGVYAGGDNTTGAATVILAMGAGKRAAKAIDEYVKNK
ncbi:MAG: NADPH-dependent glutamate synthase [Deltaproteobacteria bacterium]|nr:NADPH-dependent glutamate synthase [Deltaproteobacteria bacterium]